MKYGSKFERILVMTGNLGFWGAAILGCVIPEMLHRMLSKEDVEGKPKEVEETKAK